MEFIAKPLDDLGHGALIVVVLLASAGRLRQAVLVVLDLVGGGRGGGGRRLRIVGLLSGAAGVEGSGIARGVLTQVGDDRAQALDHSIEGSTQVAQVGFLAEHVEETGHVPGFEDLI